MLPSYLVSIFETAKGYISYLHFRWMGRFISALYKENTKNYRYNININKKHYGDRDSTKSYKVLFSLGSLQKKMNGN